ncbi:epoxyqueuosine reductase [Moorella thermoacetica]|uniref:Epoxyqueuosine reductase n=1 Tax=Neomoorella thermoacetica TaxID=1525 RepID=A0A1J5P1W3_NEOTH|nr:epoxyqueuosine reductase [Moorella thermoacetica]
MGSTKLTKELKEWAAGRGLLMGVAPVRPFERGRQALDWLARQGLTTPFATGRPEERYQPELLYPAARSLIVVARPHPQPAQPPGPGKGRIARYALGPDYHIELRTSLEDLAGMLQRAGARFTAVQVDSGPLLEREAAYLAGLGYYGASCNLILPGLGPGFSLGILITDLELEAGQPLTPATCRNCGRCLAACPTGALAAPGRLYPELCVSYLTQKRGVIPVELRPALGRYIWGCDACQEICPENRPGFSLVARGPSGAGQDGQVQEPASDPGRLLPGGETGSGLIYPDLAAIITMDKSGFNRAFGGTALAWRGKTILQRNAAIALGNMGGAGALAPLQQALRAPAAVLRGHAAWALGRLGPAARPALAGALAAEADPWVRLEIRTALDNC